jgi:transposase
VIVAIESHQGAFDMQVTTIGLDIAKNVFQVHGIDAAEKVVVRKQLRRSQVLAFFKALPPCLVGMEACATAHYWARELTKLGHQVRLMPAKDVKAYVKRNKNDAADAEAICEAVRRPTMRFVEVKSAEQQSRLMLHRTRDLLMRQRTQLINALRAHMAELGIMAAQGREGIEDHCERTGCALAGRCSHEPCRVGGGASGDADDDWIDREADRSAASLGRSKKRLRSIPGIGIVGATAIADGPWLRACPFMPPSHPATTIPSRGVFAGAFQAPARTSVGHHPSTTGGANTGSGCRYQGHATGGLR